MDKRTTEHEIVLLADQIMQNHEIRTELLEIVKGTNYRWHNFIKELHVLVKNQGTNQKEETPFDLWKKKVVKVYRDLYELEQRDNIQNIFINIAKVLRHKNTKDKEIYELIQAFEEERRLTLFSLEWDDAKLLKYLVNALELMQVQEEPERILGCIDEALANHPITRFDAGSRVTQLTEAFQSGVTKIHYEQAVADNAEFIVKNEIHCITTHENCGASALVFATNIQPLLHEKDFPTYFLSPDEIARKFSLDTISCINDTHPKYAIRHEFIQASEMDRPIYEHIAAGITVAPGEVINAMYEANPKYPYTFNVDTHFSLDIVKMNIAISLSIAFSGHGRLDEYLRQPFVIAIIGNDEKQTEDLASLADICIQTYSDKPIKVIKTTIPQEFKS